MANLRPDQDARNPLLAALLAQVLGDAIVIAIQRSDVVEALRAAITTDSPTPEKTNGLTKGELAAALSISKSTIDRLDREGAPHTFCGDHRRYDVGAYRTWLASRGKRPTRTPKGAAEIDVDDVARAGGLHPSGDVQ
jgi:hypothetical protein